MAKFKLTFWEKNGYDDSDFYCAVFDSETKTIEKIEVGSTRYACQIGPGPDLLPPTIEVVRDAIKVLANSIFERIKVAEQHDVLEPNVAHVGEKYRLLKAGSFKDKKTGKTTKYEAGQVGTCIWQGAFGFFPANGYNKRNRSNIRVGLKLESGDVVFVGLKDLRLDKEPMSDEELKERADILAQDCQFSKLFGAAWDTQNYALAVLKQVEVPA